MKTYTINDKEYTEFGIKKRCAELMGLKVEYFNEGIVHVEDGRIASPMSSSGSYMSHRVYNPCTNPSDTWPIIERVWDGLNESAGYSGESSVWSWYIDNYRCTKLVAACICFIEVNS